MLVLRFIVGSAVGVVQLAVALGQPIDAENQHDEADKDSDEHGTLPPFAGRLVDVHKDCEQTSDQDSCDGEPDAPSAQESFPASGCFLVIHLVLLNRIFLFVFRRQFSLVVLVHR